jgi:hypothetical protein
MPRATVRAAIEAYLQAGITGGDIPFLSTVYAHPPKLTREGDFVAGEAPGTATGAVIYIHLVSHNERRIAIGGAHSGRKARPYDVGLICLLLSKKTDTQQVGADNDSFIDGLTGWIQANRTANSGGPVFQWGEGDGPGTVDLKVEAGMPKTLRGQGSLVWTTVDVTALEILIT